MSSTNLLQLPAISLMVLLLALLSSCSKPDLSHIPTDRQQHVAIGPYSEFSGRLIVIEPKQRWQVLLNWKSEERHSGWLRLTHAVTSTVIEFRWFNQTMEVRSNQSANWKTIRQSQLSEHGIVIPPQQLASILKGNIPNRFTMKEENLWESRENGSIIRLQWSPDSQRLIMTDIKHGRTATLIIQS